MGLTIENLILYDDDVIFHYGIDGMHFKTFSCIGTKGKDDVAGFLEETLHRILDAGGSQEDVARIMGLYILNEEERKECEESYGYTDIDLGYVLPGSISAFFQ